MKFSKVLVSFAALTCLVACNQGPSPVSEESFAAEVAKIEDHEYATAHGKFSYFVAYSFSGMSAEEIQAMREGGMEDVSFTEEADFQWSGTQWTTNYAFEHDEAEILEVSVGRNVKTMSIEGATEAGVKLYTGPLKIVQEAEQSGLKISMSMTFEKYGYLVSLESSNSGVLGSGNGKSISVRQSMQVSVSYADAK